jgi:hypothetical protein
MFYGEVRRARLEGGKVGAYAVIEALETIRREADRGCGCEVKVAAIEEVEERVLQDFGPDFEVGEVGLAALFEVEKWKSEGCL